MSVGIAARPGASETPETFIQRAIQSRVWVE
jgi:hypothetical protein